MTPPTTVATIITGAATATQDNDNNNEAASRLVRTQVSTSRLVLVLGSLWIGVLLVALDETMIATIAIPIATSLNSFTEFSWLTTAYLLGSSTSQAFSGHLVDRFGRRNGLVVCYSLFTLGTLLCGLAPNMACFIAGRVMQGIGGGSITSVTSVVETDLIPIHKRPVVEGLANVAYGVVLAIGGVYGAAVHSSIGWKWSFLIQVPILVIDGVAVFFIASIADEKRLQHQHTQIDLVGMIAFLASIILFQYGLNSGSTSLVWTDASVVATLCVSLACFVGFLYWELTRASNPVVPVRTLLGRTVGCIQISAFFSTGAFVACLFYVPIYLEALGMDGTDTGLRLIPLAICFAVGSIVVGYAVQYLRRYYEINIAVQAVGAIAYGLLCRLHRQTPSWEVFVFLGILGTGVGGSYVTNLIGILNSVLDKELSKVLTVSWSMRALGIIVSLTIASVIFQSVSRSQMVTVFDDPDLVYQFSNTLAINASGFDNLNDWQRTAVFGAHMRALTAVFYFLLAEGSISVIISFFIENKKIKVEYSA
ncbi:MFS general substrate transporter [Decorospora gaudefroyi]|uniref:MFS general substrate transporter n=1 Tax=Decorospora gaudefroyi TaxID=184978 RepID=A0A6A5K146_9PLEO|nr:MFS general substrate transporter [Decorospora gaudefroyi]